MKNNIIRKKYKDKEKYENFKIMISQFSESDL